MQDIVRLFKLLVTTMSERRVHITRNEQIIKEYGIQQRTDDPASPIEGQEWFQSVEGVRKVRIAGNDKIYAFKGENEGQVPYSTVVKNTNELISATSSGVNNTIYLKVYDYDLTLTAYSLVTEKSLRFQGETTAQTAGKRVRIYTDSSHFVKANPTITTITNNGSVSAVNGSNTINLTSGLWATDLSGQYIFINGKYYLISSNPTQTQLILSEVYTGPSVASSAYFVAYMIKDVIFENIEFVGKNALHIGLYLRNVINPQFINCRFTTETASMFLKADLQYTTNALFVDCDFRNTKLDFTNDNYDAFISDCTIKTNTTMGSEYFVKVDTQKGVTQLPTNFKITNNTFFGPASFVKLVSSKQNIIMNNLCKEVLNNLVSIDANSNDNMIANNIVNTQASSSTVLSIASKYNVIADNRIVKTSGYAIDLASTAQYNSIVGNLLTGGATINDTLPSINFNRIEDDLSRLGSASTGTSKDLIDRLNDVITTLQNKPKVLIQQNVAVDPALTNETFVYWNDANNQYEKADGSNLAKDNAYGMVVNISGSSGDIQFIGIREILSAPSGNPQITHLYNSGYIGEKFYLGVDGVLVPESILLTNVSGVPTNQKSMGVLIDVVGGTLPQFLLLPTEEYKYGTPSNYWQLGKNDSSFKYLSFGTVSGTVSQIAFNSTNGTILYIKNDKSGEITQPFNNNYLANTVNSYQGANLLSSVSSGSITVSNHSIFIGGYRQDKSTTVLNPITGYSGDVFLFDTSVGTIVDSGIVNGVYIGLQEQSGGIFLTNKTTNVASFGRIERYNANDITPDSNSFVELEKVYIPIYSNSGGVDVVVTASTQARSSMQTLYPHQIVNIKLRVNDVDVTGSLRRDSLYFVASGEVSYSDMSVSKLVNVYSAASGMIKVSLMGRYEYGGSVSPVTFNNTNLRVEV